MSSCKKYGFLSPKNVPNYKGETPTITFGMFPPEVTFWHRLMGDGEKIICNAEGCSLRLAKKKAFKKYIKICKKNIDNRKPNIIISL